ncbi:MAG: N-acetyltransferase family protein [Phycisphaerae bacterium]
MPPTLRPAVEADLPSINEIYNHYVRTSTCTYAYEPDTMQEREAWWREHGGAYPVIVLDRGETVVGWGSLSKFRPREGYRFTCENSIYLHPDWCGQGHGGVILAELVRLAGQHGFHSIIAGICATQEPSIRLHARAGFVEVARMLEVGFKFDRWLDVVYMQRKL